MTPSPIRPDVHQRFVALVARAMERHAEHLARLRGSVESDDARDERRRQWRAMVTAIRTRRRAGRAQRQETLEETGLYLSDGPENWALPFAIARDDEAAE